MTAPADSLFRRSPPSPGTPAQHGHARPRLWWRRSRWPAAVRPRI